MKNKRLLHPKEPAEELGISIRTLIRWDKAGKSRTVRTVGNQRRIPVEELSGSGGRDSDRLRDAPSMPESQVSGRSRMASGLGKRNA